MRITISWSPLLLAFVTATALAQTVPPTADKPGSADDPLLKRYQGAVIVMYERQEFGDFTLPLGKLEPAPRGDANPLQAKSAKTVEGRKTHILYHVGRDRSPLEVARNYEQELKGQNARVLYTCSEVSCGGSASGNVQRGDPSLINFLYPRRRASEKYGTPAYCAMDGGIDGLRYAVFELDEGRGYASVAVYATSGQGGTCQNFKGATFVTVDLVETRAREQRMVAVKSTEMADAIHGAGKIALYGISFDSDKATLKPESDATLEQIGKLMKEKPQLKLLVVGHTDNKGDFSANMDLSQRRAATVVSALVARYGVKRDRLAPVGVSYAAPLASNATEEGRSKNRRVELVEN